MKDKSIKQPWPRSAKITVWVLSLILVPTLFYAIAVEPNPCGCGGTIMIDPPKPSCLPVVNTLVEQLREQKAKHPEDFTPTRTQDDEFIKEILDAEDPAEYLQSIGY